MKALTFIALPGEDEIIRPGDTIDEARLEAAGQTEEDIQRLRDGGAIGEDDDLIDRRHWPVGTDRAGNDVILHPETGEPAGEDDE